MEEGTRVKERGKEEQGGGKGGNGEKIIIAGVQKIKKRM